MRIGDPTQAEVLQGKLYGRVGLKRHSSVQAVDVQACNHGLFRVIIGFFFDDGSKGTYFFRGHTDGLGFVTPFLVPEFLVFFLHPLKEVVYAHIPIYLVGFGNKKAGYRFFFVSQSLPEQRVVHYCGYFGGVNHQLFAYAACKFIQGTYASYCQIHRLLVTSVEAAEYMIYVFAGTYRVASGVDVERVIAPL